MALRVKIHNQMNLQALSNPELVVLYRLETASLGRHKVLSNGEPYPKSALYRRVRAELEARKIKIHH